MTMCRSFRGWLSGAVAAGAGINLLQGPYGKRTEMATVLRPWRLAAGLLLGVVLLVATVLVLYLAARFFKFDAALFGKG